MSAAKHTKGPWVWGDWVNQKRGKVSDSGWVDIWPKKRPEGVLPMIACKHHDEIANARLIAAAPELLEALQTLEKRITYYASLAENEQPNIEQWAYTDQSGDLAKARAAIAKATGEQP